MRQFNITVNGVAYSVAVEEVGAASAPVAAPWLPPLPSPLRLPPLRPRLPRLLLPPPWPVARR